MAYLSFVCDLNNKAANSQGRFIDEIVVNTFRPHVAREDTPIGREASHGDPNVIVHFEELSLVGGELGSGLVNGGEDDMGFGAQPNCRAALLHSFHGVLYLMQTACWAPCRYICVVLIPKHAASLSPTLSSSALLREFFLALKVTTLFAFSKCK